MSDTLVAQDADAAAASPSDKPASDDAPEKEDDVIRVYYDFEQKVSKPTISDTFSPVGPNCPVLEIAHSFGFDSYRRRNLHILDKDTLLFVAGTYVKMYHLPTKTSTFLRCTGGGSVSCLAVHPKRQCFASGERAATNPDINIFGYPSCKLGKILSKGTQREYVSLTFDPYSGDLLASQGGEPDFNITIWNWAEEKPLLRCKSFSQDVYNVTFNEDLYGFLVTSGLSHIRFWRMAETFTGLKLKGQTGRFGARNFTNIETSIQFPDGKVLSGSEEGTMLLWEESLVVAEFRRRRFDHCHAGRINQMFMYEAEVLSLGEDGFIRTWSVDDICFVQPSFFGECFILTPMHEIQVCSQARLLHMVQSTPEDTDCSLWYTYDREGRVWRVDLSILNALPPKVMLHSHGGPVVGCAASPNAHLVATAGHDGMLRIFDCLQKVELLVMQFTSPASCLIWVPMSVDKKGASVIVGFQDGILRKVAFCAKPGSSQAQVQGKLSQVFKPHISRITSLAFSSDGKTLASGSSDRTVFLFYMQGTQFSPVGWLHMPTGVRQMVWTPVHFSFLGLLVACEEGNVLQLQISDLFAFNVTANLCITDAKLKFFKFHSIKSEKEHAEQLAKLKEEKLKLMANRSVFQAEEPSDDYTEGEDEATHDAKEEEEEEEEWEPFIPGTPSPILQVVCSETENHFWLSLGEYDAGYLYMCKFPEKYFCEEEDNSEVYLTKPVEAVAVPDCSDIPVTVLRVDETHHTALLGFSNGHIRLVQLPQTRELFDLSAYWDISAHDGKYGSLTGMEFAYDHCFVVTTGMDGNILVFSFRGLLGRMKEKHSALPLDTQHHDTCTEDLPPDTLWFAHQLEKQQLENRKREAEATKLQKRALLKELLHKAKALLFDNDRLPPGHRLSRKELLVNTDIETEHKTMLQVQLAELHKRQAWQSAKFRLLLEKAQTGLVGHEALPHQFVVKAFNCAFQVQSYRVSATCPMFEELLKTSSASERVISSPERHSDSSDDDQESTLSTDEELWQNAFAMARRRSIGLTGTVARSLKMALDKARKAKIKRVDRHNEWERLYEEKTLIDKDIPEELEAIEIAKNTIGDLKLKTDLSHAMEMVKSCSHRSACQDLAELDIHARNKITQFNEKLTNVREEKRVMICVFHEINKRLSQVSHGLASISNLPMLTTEEVPEVNLAVDAQTLLQFKDTVLPAKEPPSNEAITFQRGKSRESKPSNQYHHSYYKGERSDYPEIVKSVLNQKTQEEAVEQDIDLINTGEAFESELASSLRRDINVLSGFQLLLEKEMARNTVDYMMSEYDNKLQSLQRERFELDVFLKQADLAYLAKLQAFSLDQVTQAEEKSLIKEQIDKKEQLSKTSNACTLIKKQIVKKTEESEEYAKMLSDLWLQFQELTIDHKGGPMMSYLTFLYKRKAKKIKEVRLDSESEESSSDSSCEMSVSGSMSSMSLDLEYCPAMLDQTIYDQVVTLQKQRQVLDQAHIKVKQELAFLNKDLEQKCKESEYLKQASKKIEARHIEFCKEKLRMLNDLGVMVILPKQSLHSKASEGIVVHTEIMEKLRSRVGELKVEIHKQEQIMKNNRKQNLALRRRARIMNGEIEIMTTQCQEDMLKKFGKPVDLKKLDLMTLNPKMELLKCTLLMDRDSQMKEQKHMDTEIGQLKVALKDQMKTSTVLFKDKANMMKEMMMIERQLDIDSAKVEVSKLIKQKSERMEDNIALSQLVHLQMSAIDKCWGTINDMRPHGRRTNQCARLPPIPASYSRNRIDAARKVHARGTRNIRFPEI